MAIVFDTHQSIKNLTKAGNSPEFAKAFTYALCDAWIAKEQKEDAEFWDNPALLSAPFEPCEVVRKFQEAGCTEIMAKAVVKVMIAGVFGEDSPEAEKWREENREENPKNQQ